MDGFTLTEMADISGWIDRLTPAEVRSLHRRLKDFVTLGILREAGRRGAGEKAPAVFELHELAKARVVAKLLNYGLDAKALRTVFNIPDSRTSPNEMRFASGLENAIAAALDGEQCSASFEILNGDSRVRGRFIYAGEAPDADASRLIADHDAMTGTQVVGRLTIELAEIIRPVLDHVREIEEGEPLTGAQANPPKVD